MPPLKISKIAFLVLAFAGTSIAAGPQKIVVTSPGGRVSVALISEAAGGLECDVTDGGHAAVRLERLGLTADGVDLATGARVTGAPVTRTIDESYPLAGNHSKARNHCQEAAIPCESGGRTFHLVLRVFDDGLGVRYDLGQSPAVITGDSTTWVLPTNGKYAWSPYNNSYEDYHHFTPWEKVPQNAPLAPPFTAKLDNLYVSITESECTDFPDMAIRAEGDKLVANFPHPGKQWTATKSPWRVTLLAPDLTALVNSDVVKNLCPPPEAGRDFEWVKPGRCLWQWWSVGAPKLDDQHAWIDAAAKLGWEYYLIDDGWRTWKQPDKDQWQCLADVIAYGKSKGVKSIVWVNSKEMRDAKSRRAYLEKVKALGADGIKIDFLPPATADIMQWYQGALKDTADLKLLCNFHGAVKPTGLERTWPHNSTREAIRGHEYQITRYKRTMPREMDSILPFTRFLAGAADYTPTVFEPRELRGFTWAHELAQALVFTSPVTHFADKYQNYLANPSVDLLKAIPTTWDETIVLPASEIGGAVGFARRKGDTWWIGIVNANEPATWDLPLTFLKGPAKATILADAPDRDDAFDRKEARVGPTDKLPVTLRPGGGFVAVFSKP